jgi:hypothetical protein
MKLARIGLMAGATALASIAAGGLLAPASATPYTTVCASGCDYSTIQGAVDAASDGDFIAVSGPLTVSGTTTINKDVTVAGVPRAKVTQTADAITFRITGTGATLSNLEITSQAAVADEFVQVGANDVSLLGNTIHGPEQAGPMSGWVTNRGLVTQPSISGFTAIGNTIYSVRSGSYLNDNGTGTISYNTVYDTKGDFLIADANFAFTGNRPGDLSKRSEWSFVIFPGTDPSRYTDLAALSAANNHLSAWDQRVDGAKKVIVAPLATDDCKNSGWQKMQPAFRNQGLCVASVNAYDDHRGGDSRFEN